MGWNAKTRSDLRRACRTELRLRLRDHVPHPTKIQRMRVTFVVELRDGRCFEIFEEAWT